MSKKIITIALSVSTLRAMDRSPEEIVAKLTLREKIGQLFVIAAASNFNQPTEQLASAMTKSRYNIDPEYVENLIKKHGVGGVLFLFKSDPIKQMALTEKFQAAASTRLLMMQDSEWGLSMRLDVDPAKVVRYPRNMTLGAIQDDQIIYDVGNEIGKQCVAIGIHMNLAPVADINNNKANPVIHDRSFGDNPERVARLSKIFAHGLKSAGTLACAKHFPGHGDTTIDSHLDLPVISHDRLRLDTVELVPFHELIQSGIDAIMHAHLAVPALDDSGIASSLSHNIVTKLLREELGFKGLNITDGLGMEAVAKDYAPGELERAAFLAGNDILLCPLDLPRAIELIEAEIQAKRISEEDLNHRVLKILRAKKWSYDQEQLCDKINNIEAYLTRPEAYALQKKAYRAAITLVPQHDEIAFSIHTFNASSIVQIGKLPGNIFTQLCEQQKCKALNCSAALESEELETCLHATEKSDVVVIAITEMNKFIAQNFGIAQNTQALVKQLHEMGKKVIVILFGTPYSIELFKDADAIIMAYEDAPAAQEAVVDVLRGALQPTGILPVSV